MTWSRIDQIVSSISYGDAITNNCLEIRRVLRSWGYRSDIYAENIDPRLREEARPHTTFPQVDTEASLLLFHHSIGSDIIDTVEASTVPVVMVYHNITPPEYFAGTNPHLQRLVRKGREELARLRDRASIALADSEYSRLELVEAQFPHTGVLPILVDFDRYQVEPARKVLDTWKDRTGANILFVGRIAPNKKHEDLIRTFSYFKKCIDPAARLFMVGAYDTNDSYLTRLRWLAGRLQLKDVYFTGQVSFEELVAYYRLADVFLCQSEHEGFCVPLLEAMQFDIPIVAFKAAAVPYTLGNAGVLFTEKRHDIVAELISLLITDEQLRERVLKAQRKRLEELSKENTLRTLKYWIEQVPD